MRQPYLLALFFCFSLISHTQTIEVEGEINVDTVWDVDTVFIIGNILIPESKQLTINAGTIVLAYNQQKLEIKGSLIAKGTIEAPILFSVFDTTGFSDTLSVNDTWGGIHFVELNEHMDSSILEYCIIEYGGAFSELDKYGGGVFIDNSSNILIQNSIIQKNYAQMGGAGIYFHENATARLYDNLIIDNISKYRGGGIMITDGSYAIIDKNIIINNEAWRIEEIFPGVFGLNGQGGGIFISTLSEERNSLLGLNIICNNFSWSGGGVYESAFETKLLSNIVCNNYGSGIFTGNSISESYYVNNTIVNNKGAGIITFSENINMINNISHNNYYHFGVAGLIDTVDLLLQLDAMNGNFHYNNIGHVKDDVSSSVPDINILSIGLSNLSVFPEFVNESEGIGLEFNGYEADWSLVVGDANIDAGTTGGVLEMLPEIDAYGNDRILGETIDIGAVEFDPISLINEGLDNDQINIYPNPFSGQVWIKIQDFQGESWYLSVWNEQGQILYSFEVKHQISSVNSSSWPSGMYFIEGKDKVGERIFIKKIVKGK